MGPKAGRRSQDSLPLHSAPLGPGALKHFVLGMGWFGQGVSVLAGDIRQKHHHCDSWHRRPTGLGSGVQPCPLKADIPKELRLGLDPCKSEAKSTQLVRSPTGIPTFCSPLERGVATAYMGLHARSKGGPLSIKGLVTEGPSTQMQRYEVPGILLETHRLYISGFATL